MPIVTNWRAVTLGTRNLFFPLSSPIDPKQSLYEYDGIGKWKIVGTFQQDYRYDDRRGFIYGVSAASEVSLDMLWKFCK